MKTKLIALAIFCFCISILSAQTRIFQNSVHENSISNEQKISKELSSTYSLTQYYTQPSFNLQSDLQISLPTNKEITARFARVFRYSNGSESYLYHFDNDPKAELVLSKYDNIITGMYASGTEKVMFHQTKGDIFALSVVNDAKMISQDSKDDYILDNSASFNKANPDICSAATPVCGTTRIDVMVVFTGAARAAWGGVSQSNSFIATAITNFNTALTNSGVSNVTINLVYSGEITYTESGNISTDLTRFRTNNDTFMDNIHTMRTTYGADVCALVTSTPTSTCGLGNLNTNPTNYSGGAAFSVTLYNCVVSNYSLAHEMGHNMGLRHDWYVDTASTPCSHHHGYVNRTAINLGASSTTSQRWRTIMAYSDECVDIGINCSRINRWANPAVNYNTEPTGIAIGNTNPSNEAYGFSRFACVVSTFMAESTLAAMEANPEIKDFTLYPNPAREVINVSINDNRKYSFKIYNSLGQLVTTTSERSINLKGWAPGEYFIRIYNEKNSLLANKKFIIR
ncbi:hypothetical protein HNP38_002726 [Chryseobacterium defluvii]|uniref:Secretion system C-terminal sorting domain-containing protein n=1 Tax=Chryseobacterium defluvii TaxID=160396 RepID=A0A840KIU8_9FLAO|nr:zinc-dependent metalloprotease [Chryseobacterium defluvii]MBB4807420.1 hypothetical protein [Chryseobacterium defluvii]